MSKRYRRRIFEYDLIETLFDDVERGPLVHLGEDGGSFTVPWEEFKAEWEEVPEGEQEREETKDRDMGVEIEHLHRYLGKVGNNTEVVIRHTPMNVYVLAAGALRAILAAAKAHLARCGEESPSASRCRVGGDGAGDARDRTLECVPHRYLDANADEDSVMLCRGMGGNHENQDLVKCDEITLCEVSEQYFYFSSHAWDAARDKWIADGRPSS